MIQSAALPQPATSTKSLLSLGIVAGPIYIAVSLAQALTRDGFDLARHPWSLLANGDLGWIHISNLMVTGLLTIAFAVGLLRAGNTTWTSRLIGAFGLSLVGAGIFRADPAMGFPPGTPDSAAEATLQGLLHFSLAGIGFICLIAACFVVARRFKAEGSNAWATYSRATGIVFLAGFATVASGAQGTGPNLAFTAAVVVAWAWVSALALHHYGTA
jgi:Protein of unknown function (DUF998)